MYAYYHTHFLDTIVTVKNATCTTFINFLKIFLLSFVLLFLLSCIFVRPPSNSIPARISNAEYFASPDYPVYPNTFPLPTIPSPVSFSSAGVSSVMRFPSTDPRPQFGNGGYCKETRPMIQKRYRLPLSFGCCEL